jgi:hypothetical protein
LLWGKGGVVCGCVCVVVDDSRSTTTQQEEREEREKKKREGEKLCAPAKTSTNMEKK